jgi:hypothetical protein
MRTSRKLRWVIAVTLFSVAISSISVLSPMKSVLADNHPTIGCWNLGGFSGLCCDQHSPPCSDCGDGTMCCPRIIVNGWINEVIDDVSGWHYGESVPIIPAQCTVEFRSCDYPGEPEPCRLTGIWGTYLCPNPIQPKGPETCP